MSEHQFDSYDYLKVTVEEAFLSQYMDGYEKLGWKADENRQTQESMGKATLYFKRSRHIINKVELTRLQQHFESCMGEISTLEASKNSVPTMVSLALGLTGCGFMAGSVFAVTAAPPIIWLTALFGSLGFLLWAAAYFSYRTVKQKRSKKVSPLIEAKYDEAYEVCEKAVRLL